MAEDEYEILPHQLLQDLKFDVESLKKKLTQPDSKSNELILEIESLKDSVHELDEVFKKALDETKGEPVSSVIKELKEKIENVVDQNETIARALISISDKLDTFMDIQRQQPRPMNRSVPVQHTMTPPNMPLSATMPMSGPMPGRMAPPPDMPRMPMPSGNFSSQAPIVPIPPPPSPGMKRKGLFQ